MKIVNESPGTELDSLLILESILFVGITGKNLSAGMYDAKKTIEIAKLVTILAKQNQYDLDIPIHLICAKHLLLKSVYNN